MKGLLPRFAFGMLAVLVIAAVLMSLGQREIIAHPSATSYDPSGLHALQELLHRNNIETSVSRYRQPKLRENDLVIAAYIDKQRGEEGDIGLKDIETSLKSFLEKGGRVLVMPFDRDFRNQSRKALENPTPVVSYQTQETLSLNTWPSDYGFVGSWMEGEHVTMGPSFLPITGDNAVYSAWIKNNVDSQQPFLEIASVGKGMLARTTDGLFATNRFIARNDNAQMALRTVQGLLPEGGKVIFLESTLGGGISPSLASTLGPWAEGVWNQSVVLFLVVIFTLGIRFGLPAQARRKQSGQREMVDAVSDVYLRARSTAVALDVAYRNADQRIRRALKLPAHVNVQERDRHLPGDLAATLASVWKAKTPQVTVDAKGRQKVHYSLDPHDALRLIQKLEGQLNAFVPKTRNRIS